MKLVTRDDLGKWAQRNDAKGMLPYLISKLVRATTPFSTKVDFPSGSATFMGGLDGTVTCLENTPYVPIGKSLYELGTEAGCKGKADDDYNKRKADLTVLDPKDCVFIFITPRTWGAKKKWIASKKKENYWKDVKVYDAVDLEQWLDIALAISRWFSGLIGAYPFDGMMTTDEFWEEWSVGPNNIQLVPEVVIAGREYEAEQLLSTLKGPATIKGVKASTKNEAIAFIIGAAKRFPIDDSERFFAKSLVIDTEGNFRGIRINTITPLNLIPRFDDVQHLYVAVSKGHHVLVPLGADDTFNQETITLPTNDRDKQIQALSDSGVSKEDAEKFSRESARNITILKKLIGFPFTKAKWATTENIREIIPAMLLGRWNESYKGDVELIERLADQKYADYSLTLSKWKNFQDSPILQIGETWRLTSPLDMWTNFSSLLSIEDYKKIQESFLDAYVSKNPVLEPDDKDDFVSLYNKKRKYSGWSREGLAQSLILISRCSEGLKLPAMASPQQWVDNIISKLLYDASGETWISVDRELPLLSEASSNGFFTAASHSLSKVSPEIMDLFMETDGFLHPSSNHTGLLWALEGLAWEPEYLMNASLILLQLTSRDPGGKLSNRPINSLIEIFKPWHYQTMANFQERMKVLLHITEVQKDAGWNLLINLLPDHRGVAHPTHKMRWKMFDKNTKLSYTYKEVDETHSFIIDLLIQRFDGSENKFSQFIREIDKLAPIDRHKVLDWAKKSAEEISFDGEDLLESLRKILNRHRSHPDTNWAMPENDLTIIEEIYNRLKPTDIISQLIWLFNDHWPAFPDVSAKGEMSAVDFDNQGERIDKERQNAAKRFISELGLDKTLALRKEIKEPWSLGDALARVVTDMRKILKICQTSDEDESNPAFFRSFMFRKFFTEGFEWIKKIVSIMSEDGYKPLPVANALIPIPQSKELWDFVESLEKTVQIEYWLKMDPRFYNLSTEEKIYGLNKLMEYKRFIVAVYFAYHSPKELPSSLLVDLLKMCALAKSNDPQRLRGYEVQSLFEELDKRDDIEDSVMVDLEWLYLSILASYGSHRNPKFLQFELSRNPSFFVDVLKWIYKPKEDSKVVEPESEVAKDILENRAKQGYQLLRSWIVIPGMHEDFSIDKEKLGDWIREARRLAAEVGRIEVADMHIGQVLAQYPEDIPGWPNEAIFQAMESINSDSMKRNYSAAMFNKRGSSTRGPFEGGDIERGHAAYFKILADQNRNKFPNVSEVFQNLQSGYLADAKRIDEEAERDKLEY